MRRIMQTLALGICWVLTAALTALETTLAWNWRRGMLYLAEAGAAQNPYAAEDTENSGLCALLLLPLVLAALTGTVSWTIWQHKKRANAQSEK